MNNICLLGSTGSIGTNALDVISKNKDRFKVIALSANKNIDILEQQIYEFNPKKVVVVDHRQGKLLKERLINKAVEVIVGDEGLMEIVGMEEVDLVINSLVGIAGLLPTYTALQKGKNIALANKETLVVGGQLIMDLARQRSLNIIPIDSEHSAIFQCIQGDKNISKIILTASGGPFRGFNPQSLALVTPEQALKHPKWDMGRKISIDSATLMNKGLEVIEAHWLFNMNYKDIEVVVHPQSIIHSMVEYKDGSIIAQMGINDMRIPIQYALTYPERIEMNLKLDLVSIGQLTFEKPDYKTFNCLSLAYEAGKIGGTMPTVLNGANEVVVDLFLNRKIAFKDIPLWIERSMEKHNVISNPTIEDILQTDEYVRKSILKNFN
jgi:1-deoxy-D-xylulose-5-phosphate reductoisomerase